MAELERSGAGEAVATIPVRLTEARQRAIPVLLGVVAFFVVTGGRILAPRNIAWLSKGDPATYCLGWNFFQHTPWGWPLGMSPRYGAELSSSIAFVDNVPLFAFAFKAMGRLLPDVFQYLGLWLLCCFVLQAWFAWLLVGLFTRSAVARACGAALFVFAPTFLWRLQGHYQMNGQWLVLAALYLCLGPRRLARGPAWPALAFAACLIHTYLTAMVLGLWLTDWLRRVIFEGRTRAELWQLITVPALVLLGVWQAGLFDGTGLRKGGFGIYRLNLASLVDSSGWSYLLKDLPEAKGDYEGFNFLGLGGILLAVLALPALSGAWRAVRAKREYWPLFGLLSALTLFAISNRVGLADRNFVIPLPESWVDHANLFRACGRMFWPVYYALFWLVIRTLFKRYPPRAAAAILFIALTIQAVDTSAGWLPIRRDLMISGSSWDSPLKAAFWSRVPGNYRVIRIVPPRNQAPNYATFAYFAAMHGMSTDAVYFSRIDTEKLVRAKAEAMLAVNEGRYAERTLYILDRHYERAARRSLHPDVDLLAWVDGFLVLAPGWKCRPECAVQGAAKEDCSASCPKN